MIFLYSKKITVFFAGFFLSLCLWLVADESQVVEIEIVGLERLSEQFVLSRIATRVGASWDPTVAARDYTRLYMTDRFLSVDIDSEVIDQGVKVVIRVKESPLVTKIVFDGIENLSYKDLISGMEEEGLKNLPQEEGEYYGQALSDGLHRDILRAVERAARKKNFMDVSVSTQVVPNEESEGVTLVVRVVESHKIYVDNFNIHSESGFSQRFVGNNTRLFTKEKFLIFQSGVFDPDLLSDDILQIIYMFRDRGYLDVTVDATVERETAQPGWFKRLIGGTTEDKVDISLYVKEGPLYSWGEMSVEGATIFSNEEILETFGLMTGEIADNSQLQDATERLEELYGDEGYLPEGRFPDPVLTRIYIEKLPDARTRTVDLKINIREGQPITIRDLIVRGNEKTRDEVIRREMLSVLPGNPYNWSAQKEAIRRLKNLNFFLSETGVNLQVSKEIGETQRDLILDVQEDETGSLGFGFSVSSEGDVNANVSFNQSNFDVTDVSGFPFNFADIFRNRQYVGKGQDLSLLLSPGTRRSVYSGNLFEPWFLGYPIGLGLSVSFSEDIFDDYDQERFTTAVTFSRRWYLGPQELVTVGLRFRHDDVEVSNIDANAPSFITDNDLNTTINGVMPFASYDSRDSIRFPTEGQLHELSLERAGEPLGGLDFTRISQKSAFYWTTWVNREEEEHVMSVTSRLDWIEPFDETKVIPITERYFLGGMRTLRGYDFATIGPHENDVPIGGTTRHHGSLEYIVPLAGRHLRGVTFFDYGALHQEPPGDWINNYRFSVGVGLRLIVPRVNIPIRFELAEPVGPKSNRHEREFFNFTLSAKTTF